MDEVREARDQYRAGLITLGDYLSTVDRLLDTPAEEPEPEEDA